MVHAPQGYASSSPGGVQRIAFGARAVIRERIARVFARALRSLPAASRLRVIASGLAIGHQRGNVADHPGIDADQAPADAWA